MTCNHSDLKTVRQLFTHKVTGAIWNFRIFILYTRLCGLSRAEPSPSENPGDHASRALTDESEEKRIEAKTPYSVKIGLRAKICTYLSLHQLFFFRSLESPLSPLYFTGNIRKYVENYVYYISLYPCDFFLCPYFSLYIPTISLFFPMKDLISPRFLSIDSGYFLYPHDFSIFPQVFADESWGMLQYLCVSLYFEETRQ